MSDDAAKPDPWGPPPGAPPPADVTDSVPGPPYGPPAFSTPPPPPPPPPLQQVAASGSSGTGGSRFAVGLLIGLVIGGLIGGVAGGLIGWFASDSEPAPRTVNEFEMNDSTPPSVQTTREEPAPIGTTISIGNGWDVTVSGFDANATDAVLSADEFTEPPLDGERFVLVELEATYVGGSKPSEAPFFGMDLGLVGASNVERTEFDAFCTAPDPELDSTSELYPGGTARGNVCFVVPDGDADTAVLVVSPSMSFDSTKSFFSLR